MNIVENQLTTIFSRSWWILLLRGIIAILFGILLWFQPEISLVAMLLLFGTFALMDGILGIWTAVIGRKIHEHWWVLLLWGFIGVGVGVLTFVVPGVTALALLFYIAIWAVATGTLQIVAAIRLRKEMTGEWLLILGGLASLVFGILLMAQPAVGALALLWLIGAYAIIFGILLVSLAFKTRTFSKQSTHNT
ncbi:Uncharacterized membrane protein HdeD, DUF308 family [Nitrosomonas eutropha]|uniref:HdeD family acid-resistance protein n=1 Tax=Nitrosomonas eutropha TaxID=916 RepID=UPI00088F7900|nr:HdeD family acid-resistance protein [Nitrosomonas eutropha]SCX26955.1 Uncharacterized membrane protein HdeD, DUF308 family [Nitrosomonas eutropha]